MKKRIGTYFLLAGLVFILTLAFSFIYPGNNLQLDALRLKVQTPIIQLLSDFKIRDVYSINKCFDKESADITYAELDKYLKELEPATIFFTRSIGYAGSVLIRGDWKHAAIYLGTKVQIKTRFGNNSDISRFLRPYYKTGNEVLILDSSCEGVLVREFKELSNLYSKSFLRSLVCFNIQASEAEIQTFIQTAVNYVGKDFDFDFIITDDSSVYCSELVYRCLNSIGIIVDEGSDFLGRSLISPTDLVTYISGKGIVDDKFSLQLFLTKKNGIVKANYSDTKSFTRYGFVKQLNRISNLENI